VLQLHVLSILEAYYMARSVTLKDIAREVGVSHQLVSKVVNGGSPTVKVGKDMQKKILRVAEELGYRPNRSARAIQQGRFNCLSLLLSTGGYRSFTPPDLLSGILDEMSRHGLRLNIVRAPDERLTEDAYIPNILGENDSDGLIVNYNVFVPPRFPELLSLHRIPAVWLNAKLDADCVFPDERDASSRATNQLIADGHERILYADRHTSSHFSLDDRLAGYLDAMAQAGLSPRTWRGEGAPLEEWRKAVAQIMRAPDRPTAIVAYSPPEIWSTATAVLELGLRIPADVRLVTFNQESADVIGVPITTWLIPEADLGRAAVQMLLPKISHPSKPSPPVAVRYAKSRT
jgi:LacI family transcriptional regulator